MFYIKSSINFHPDEMMLCIGGLHEMIHWKTQVSL